VHDLRRPTASACCSRRPPSRSKAGRQLKAQTLQIPPIYSAGLEVASGHAGRTVSLEGGHANASWGHLCHGDQGSQTSRIWVKNKGFRQTTGRTARLDRSPAWVVPDRRQWQWGRVRRYYWNHGIERSRLRHGRGWPSSLIDYFAARVRVLGGRPDYGIATGRWQSRAGGNFHRRVQRLPGRFLIEAGRFQEHPAAQSGICNRFGATAVNAGPEGGGGGGGGGGARSGGEARPLVRPSPAQSLRLTLPPGIGSRWQEEARQSISIGEKERFNSGDSGQEIKGRSRVRWRGPKASTQGTSAGKRPGAI
jgi:hypothetical protein